jgi:putative nucleotidyltransferase with HDIG domain
VTGGGSLLGLLGQEDDYERRLEALLDEAVALAGLPAAYLYVADASGRRFHLERARTPALPVEATEGGVATIAPTPPLELRRAPEYEGESVLDSAAGRLWSLPLDLDGRLVGLLQVGPVDGKDVGRRAKQRLRESRLPLAVFVERAHAEHALQQRLAALSAQTDVGRRLVRSAVDVESAVSLLLELALRTTRTDGGFVAVVDDAGGLAVRAESGLPEGWSLDLSPETGVFDWSPAAAGGALVLRDLDAAADLGVRSILAVPLLRDEAPLGVFALVNFGDAGTFDEQSLELLATFSEQIKLMLHNARLFASFAEEYLETLKGLARSLDARRPSTHGHHALVAEAAAAIAADVGEAPEALRTAGLVHDVGLAGVVEADGFSVDVEHPTVGASLVSHLPLAPAVAEAIAAHHEWYDGWGFPNGLRGEAIPRAGRVLACAEFLIEMASGDAVREPWDAERLASEIAHRRGSQFDPEVADAAVRLLPGLIPRPSERED